MATPQFKDEDPPPSYKSLFDDNFENLNFQRINFDNCSISGNLFQQSFFPQNDLTNALNDIPSILETHDRHYHASSNISFSNSSATDSQNQFLKSTEREQFNATMIQLHQLMTSDSIQQSVEPILSLFQFTDHPKRTYFTKENLWPDGEGCYHGELDWKSRREGVGRMEWRDGNRLYFGQWKKNKMSGEGIMWWRGSGNVYRGSWRKGLVDGKGRLDYGPQSATPKDYYEGEFKKGRIHGQGVYWMSPVKKLIVGKFKRNFIIKMEFSDHPLKVTSKENH